MLGQALVQQMHGALVKPRRRSTMPSWFSDQATPSRYPSRWDSARLSCSRSSASTSSPLYCAIVPRLINDQASPSPSPITRKLSRARSGSAGRSDVQIAAQPRHESQVVVRPRHPGPVAEALVTGRNSRSAGLRGRRSRHAPGRLHRVAAGPAPYRPCRRAPCTAPGRVSSRTVAASYSHCRNASMPAPRADLRAGSRSPAPRPAAVRQGQGRVPATRLAFGVVPAQVAEQPRGHRTTGAPR